MLYLTLLPLLTIAQTDKTGETQKCLSKCANLAIQCDVNKNAFCLSAVNCGKLHDEHCLISLIESVNSHNIEDASLFLNSLSCMDKCRQGDTKSITSNSANNTSLDDNTVKDRNTDNKKRTMKPPTSSLAESTNFNSALLGKWATQRQVKKNFPSRKYMIDNFLTWFEAIYLILTETVQRTLQDRIMLVNPINRHAAAITKKLAKLTWKVNKQTKQVEKNGERLDKLDTDLKDHQSALTDLVKNGLQNYQNTKDNFDDGSEKISTKIDETNQDIEDYRQNAEDETSQLAESEDNALTNEVEKSISDTNTASQKSVEVLKGLNEEFSNKIDNMKELLTGQVDQMKTNSKEKISGLKEISKKLKKLLKDNFRSGKNELKLLLRESNKQTSSFLSKVNAEGKNAQSQFDQLKGQITTYIAKLNRDINNNENQLTRKLQTVFKKYSNEVDSVDRNLAKSLKESGRSVDSAVSEQLGRVKKATTTVTNLISSVNSDNQSKFKAIADQYNSFCSSAVEQLKKVDEGQNKLDDKFRSNHLNFLQELANSVQNFIFQTDKVQLSISKYVNSTNGQIADYVGRMKNLYTTNLNNIQSYVSKANVISAKIDSVQDSAMSTMSISKKQIDDFVKTSQNRIKTLNEEIIANSKSLESQLSQVKSSVESSLSSLFENSRAKIEKIVGEQQGRLSKKLQSFKKQSLSQMQGAINTFKFASGISTDEGAKDINDQIQSSSDKSKQTETKLRELSKGESIEEERRQNLLADASDENDEVKRNSGKAEMETADFYKEGLAEYEAMSKGEKQKLAESTQSATSEVDEAAAKNNAETASQMSNAEAAASRAADTIISGLAEVQSNSNKAKSTTLKEQEKNNEKLMKMNKNVQSSAEETGDALNAVASEQEKLADQVDKTNTIAKDAQSNIDSKRDELIEQSKLVLSKIKSIQNKANTYSKQNSEDFKKLKMELSNRENQVSRQTNDLSREFNEVQLKIDGNSNEAESAFKSFLKKLTTEQSNNGVKISNLKNLVSNNTNNILSILSTVNSNVKNELLAKINSTKQNDLEMLSGFTNSSEIRMKMLEEINRIVHNLYSRAKSTSGSVEDILSKNREMKFKLGAFTSFLKNSAIASVSSAKKIDDALAKQDELNANAASRAMSKAEEAKEQARQSQRRYVEKAAAAVEDAKSEEEVINDRENQKTKSAITETNSQMERSKTKLEKQIAQENIDADKLDHNSKKVETTTDAAGQEGRAVTAAIQQQVETTDELFNRELDGESSKQSKIEKKLASPLAQGVQMIMSFAKEARAQVIGEDGSGKTAYGLMKAYVERLSSIANAKITALLKFLKSSDALYLSNLVKANKNAKTTEKEKVEIMQKMNKVAQEMKRSMDSAQIERNKLASQNQQNRKKALEDMSRNAYDVKRKIGQVAADKETALSENVKAAASAIDKKLQDSKELQVMSGKETESKLRELLGILQKSADDLVKTRKKQMAYIVKLDVIEKKVDDLVKKYEKV